MMNIDINCDMGEGFGAYTLGNDAAILDYITSANIACGFHAGDQSTMRKTVQSALKKDVAIGAHPGLQDLIGFGRRQIMVTPEETYDLVVYQVGALWGVTKAAGAELQHVKAHGALYNMAGKDPRLAEAIAEAVYDVDPGLILYGLAGSELIQAGKKLGLSTASEIFADRTYQQDGSLTPRSDSNAFIEKDADAINQVIQMIQHNTVTTEQNTTLPIQADTICLHGDGKYALHFAKKIKQALHQENISVVKAKEFL